MAYILIDSYILIAVAVLDFKNWGEGANMGQTKPK